MGFRRHAWLFVLTLGLGTRFLFAAPQNQTAPSATLSAPNLFARHFFMTADQRLAYKLHEIRDLLFMETPDPRHNTRYSLVTNFGSKIIQSQLVPELSDFQAARKWVEENTEVAVFEGVEIKRVKVPFSGQEKYIYFVGHKGFDSAEEAQTETAQVKALVEAQGGNFSEAVSEAQRYARATVPEAAAEVEVTTQAQFEKEEKIMLKFLDQLDIGNELFGPFQGVPSGERITWQSFGETSWRETNLDRRNFNAQVGFWTNRLVFKGIRVPFNTIDPFVEATAALESNGKDFASHLDLTGGLEWRPFARSAALYNFRPWGLPLLEWVRNYRFYIQYTDRKNLKDEIAGSRDYDWIGGIQIFYEFGVEPPELGETSPATIPDYLRRYVWGEYFGSYHYEATNFGTEPEGDFDAFLLNSSLIFGVKLPGVPLPDNPLFEEIILMPYMRFEHTHNLQHSFFYQNYYFLGAGVRWMPFATQRFKENEWLAKTKIFAEYVGIGAVQYVRQDGEPPNTLRRDWRIGVNISQKRF